MPEVIRRPFTGALTSVGGLFALLIGLAAIDERVRDQVVRAFTTRGAADEITTFGSRMGNTAMIAAQALRDQSLEHAPLVIFAVVAAILLVLMTRTVTNH